jgi:hypothetical protein
MLSKESLQKLANGHPELRAKLVPMLKQARAKIQCNVIVYRFGLGLNFDLWEWHMGGAYDLVSDIEGFYPEVEGLVKELDKALGVGELSLYSYIPAVAWRVVDGKLVLSLSAGYKGLLDKELKTKFPSVGDFTQTIEQTLRRHLAVVKIDSKRSDTWG